MRRLLALLLTLLGVALAAPGDVDVSAELRTAHDLVAQSLREYEAGKTDEAFRTARSAYLDHFEYAEPPLRVLNPDLILEMEYRFADLRNGMKSGARIGELQKIAGDINESLRKAQSIVSGTGILAPTLAATGGFTILFREGLEAALLMAAILAYLASTRNDRLRGGVWYGALAALVATAVTWYAATYLLSIAPVSRELISAITSAIAVVILFYLSFWMLQQGDRKRSAEFMRARVSQAVQSGSLGAVALVTFTTIYREGFETVLFYQALAVASGPVMGYMYLGVALAVLALAVVFAVIFRLGRRVPTQRLFPILVAVTALFAVAFVGNGVRAFQEAGWLPVTNLYGKVPTLDPNVAALTGLHPTVETLAAQVLMILVYVVGYAVLRLREGERFKRKAHS
ncbi:FTR1 family iron permease [Deinococcus yavapaiensis]|uniref:High-affinity iron transporter n=1 Tax=Deinococcus yavapaiensis KR-236 TaxID=694435 RepID=A0A318SPG4_9DEIO|nr:FTR1 family protein [Deinococcus yavapaiensis]PYE54640.1 high-affinity iron transporter [Deinococcus yavapaiensis KR-236]